MQPNGDRIPISNVRSLKLELEDVLMTPPPSPDKFPTYSEPRVRPLIYIERRNVTAAGIEGATLSDFEAAMDA